MERSDSQNYNVGKKYMGKKASAAPVAAAKKAMSAVKPCAKKKTDRISIFSPWANRMVTVHAFGVGRVLPLLRLRELHLPAPTHRHTQAQIGAGEIQGRAEGGNAPAAALCNKYTCV